MMEKIIESEADYKYGGFVKTVVGPDEDGYVLKYFRENSSTHSLYSYKQQQEIIEKKKRYFGKFIPETILIKDDEEHYHIKQKFISGKLLKFVDIETLSTETLKDLIELIKSYIKYCLNEHVFCDVLGHQKETIILNDLRERRYITYGKLFYRSFLDSTNIIISNDGKVYMIDVCDAIRTEGRTRMDKLKKMIKSSIREMISRMGTSNILYKLEETEKNAELYESLKNKKKE